MEPSNQSMVQQRPTMLRDPGAPERDFEEGSAGSDATSAIRQKYNIDNHRNIISLNGKYPTFKVEFTVISEGKYRAVVVDQHQLDTLENLPYRDSTTTSQGEWFNGELEYTDTIPRQFYLVLISEDPTTAIVQLLREPLAAKPQMPPSLTPPPVGSVGSSGSAPPHESVKKISNTWLIVGVILILAIVIGVVLATKQGGSSMPNIDELLANF